MDQPNQAPNKPPAGPAPSGRDPDGGKAPTGIRLSSSVGIVCDRLGDKRKVSSWEITKALLSNHPEYAKGMAKQVAKRPGPAAGDSRLVAEWLASARRLLKPKGTSELHGRLMILCLCELDQGLQQYLTAEGLLEVLKSEIKEQPPSSLFVSPSGGSRLPDPAPLHADNPALVDQLGRKSFARALAVRLDRIWNQHHASGAPSSFVLHLHGPWGSGKTSLLTMLGQELQGTPPAEGGVTEGVSRTSRWIVVDFNAWRYQRFDPPWWPLLKAIYRQGKEQLGRNYTEYGRAWLLALREHTWRVGTGRRDFLAVSAAIVMVGLIIYLAVGALGSGIADIAKPANDVLAIVATLLSGGIWLTRSLASGSAAAAQAFVESSNDPMREVRRHFRTMLKSIDHPVIIFIDDLDRCQPKYVITLLEGIQTLFDDSRIVYVLSADRRWLHRCFETTYETFADCIREPGKGLGSLFLEKAVQLSVSVPRLSPKVQERYWRSLVQGAGGGAPGGLAELEAEVRKEFGVSADEGEVRRILAAPAGGEIRQQFRRQIAVEHLAKAKIEESTSYFLKPFAPLLEPNPRAMKRLLNSYSVHRDLAVLAGIDVLGDLKRRQQLALWTILCLRWPALEEYLLGLVAKRADEPSSAVQELLRNEAVQKVLAGEGIGTQLDIDAIGELAGLMPSEPTGSPVA